MDCTAWHVRPIDSGMRRVAVVLLAVFAASCASKTVSQPFPTPTARRAPATAPPPAARPEPPASVDTPARVLGDRIVDAALQYRGIPYKNGGADPTGFDCSGFVQYVLAKFDWRLPRETRAQFSVGTRVPRDAIQAGDLVFFSTVADGASHVGIAVDADEFVHAPNSRGVVRVESLNAAYWRQRFLGARRME